MNWGRNSFFVFALMFLFTSTYASKDLAGDTFLKNGDYKKAIEAYESVVQEGYIGHELFFNLGTAYSKIGNVSQSILNFEKALRLSPLDKATKEQLMQLNIKLQDKPSIYQDTGLLAFIKKVQFALSIDAWAFLSVFWMVMFAAVIFLAYKFQQWKVRKWLFLSSIVWFILSGFTLLMARNNYHARYLHTEGIVNKESIKVFNQSNLNSSILFNLHLGTKVEIDDSTSSLYHIEFAEKSGWISMQDVQKIEL